MFYYNQLGFINIKISNKTSAKWFYYYLINLNRFFETGFKIFNFLIIIFKKNLDKIYNINKTKFRI